MSDVLRITSGLSRAKIALRHMAVEGMTLAPMSGLRCAMLKPVIAAGGAAGWNRAQPTGPKLPTNAYP